MRRSSLLRSELCESDVTHSILRPGQGQLHGGLCARARLADSHR